MCSGETSDSQSLRCLLPKYQFKPARVSTRVISKGSPVFGRTADEIEVHLGSLDAPDQLMPTYESWIVRRESWLPPFPLTRRYERNRDDAGRFEE